VQTSVKADHAIRSLDTCANINRDKWTTSLSYTYVLYADVLSFDSESF